MTIDVSADNLLRYRDRFPILKRTKYLVSHSLGAMPEAARDALEEYAELWASPGVAARIGGHAAQRHDRRGGGAVVVRIHAATQSGGHRGGRISVRPVHLRSAG